MKLKKRLKKFLKLIGEASLGEMRDGSIVSDLEGLILKSTERDGL